MRESLALEDKDKGEQGQEQEQEQPKQEQGQIIQKQGQEKHEQEKQEQVQQEKSWATQLEHAEITILWSTIRRYFKYRPIPGVKGSHSKMDQYVTLTSEAEAEEEGEADNNANNTTDNNDNGITDNTNGTVNNNDETTGNNNVETTGNNNIETTGNNNIETAGNNNDETTGNNNDETAGNNNDETTGNNNDETAGNNNDEITGNNNDETAGNNNDETISNNNDNSIPDATPSVTPSDVPKSTKSKATATICTTDDVISEAWWRLLLCNPNLQSITIRQDLLHFRQLSKSHPTALGSVHTVITQLVQGRLPALPPNVVKVEANFSSINGRYSRHDELGPVNESVEEVIVKQPEYLGQLRQVFFQAPKLRKLVLVDVALKDVLTTMRDEIVASEQTSVVEAEKDEKNEITEAEETEEAEERAATRSGVQIVKCEGVRPFGRNAPSRLERLFRLTPKLVEFYGSYWTKEFANVFAEFCPLLEVVRIEQPLTSRPLHRDAKHAINDNVSPLLTACSKLRVVDILYEYVDAKKVAEKPWVCVGLEELRCQFVGVPYLEKKEQATVDKMLAREKEMNSNSSPHADTTAVTTTITRSTLEEELFERTKQAQEIRRQVLAQLSKLPGLKRLTLSPDLKITDFSNADMYALLYRSKKDDLHYLNYRDTRPDCLYLRLDCGLDQLATMTELEFLAFESMDPMMQKEDIEWLAKHFPKLKEMRGMALDTHVGIEEDLERSALRELLQALRPDILHTESFVLN
ncbi:hypothetical protein EC991_000153 [Linnemannia zychae]|nr:hypothetical protein EC991_000153 [Linnemannia zychae]